MENILSTHLYFEEVKRFRTLLKNTDIGIHFIGVGGIGMYSLFHYYKKRGYSVSGSDRESSELVQALIDKGEKIYIGHSKSSLKGASVIVYSSAVPNGDKELSLSRALGIPAFSRAVALGSLIFDYKNSIGVSGTHGKSTSSYMLYSILSAYLNADAVIGAPFTDTLAPFSFNGSDTLVYEACEYKDSFLYFFPKIAVFLNLELDHTDYFENTEAIKRSFARAMENAELVIINNDDAMLKDAARGIGRPVVRVGSSFDSDYRLTDKFENGGKYGFLVEERGGRVTKIDLSLVGEHQIYNALCAFAAAREVGVPAPIIRSVLLNLAPLCRRLQRIGDYKNHPVYYDYAHHPTEILASIRTISEIHSAPTVIFKPHTFSRTHSLMDGFVRSLSLARTALILDIDGIREKNESGVSSEELVRKIGQNATRVTENDFLNHIGNGYEPIIIMGAANMDKIKEILKETRK